MKDNFTHTINYKVKPHKFFLTIRIQLTSKLHYKQKLHYCVPQVMKFGHYALRQTELGYNVWVMHEKNPRYKSSTQNIQTVTETKLHVCWTCINCCNCSINILSLTNEILLLYKFFFRMLTIVYIVGKWNAPKHCETSG
jgi:hypothetical protein